MGASLEYEHFNVKLNVNSEPSLTQHSLNFLPIILQHFAA